MGTVISPKASIPIKSGKAAIVIFNSVPRVFDHNFLVDQHIPAFIQFSRLSTATYFDKVTHALKDASVDQARFESNGLLVEKQSANLFPYSNNWTRDQLTASINAVVTDGVIRLSGGIVASCRSVTSITQELSTLTQMSVLVQTDNGSKPDLRGTSSLSDGTLIITNGTVTPTSYKDKQQGNYYVISGNRPVTIASSIIYGVWSYAANKPGTVNYYFIQVEPNINYNSSFIRTQGHATTRVPDQLTIKAKDQATLIRYQRQDNNEIETRIVDIVDKYTFDLNVGCHIQRIKTFETILSAADKNKEILKSMIQYDHNFMINQMVPDFIQFSRLSAATYLHNDVLIEVAPDVSRFEENGLLLEKQSTNLFPNNMWSNEPLLWANWGTVNKNIETHQLTPTLYFTKSGANAAQGVSGINSERLMAGNATDYTFSMRYKSTQSMNYLYIISSGANQSFPSMGLTVPPQPTTTFQNYAVKLNPTPFSAATLLIGISSSNQFDFAFNNLQFETLAYKTSLIKTNGTPVTRAADTLSIDAVNQSILVKYKRQDNQAIVTAFIDAATKHNLDLEVGCHLQRVMVFDHLLSSSEKNFVLQEFEHV